MNVLPPTGMRAHQQPQQAFVGSEHSSAQIAKTRGNIQPQQRGHNPTPAAQSENEVLKTLQHYVQQLLLVPLPSSSSNADSNPTPNSSQPQPPPPVDATPEALSYVYRIWMQLMQSPSPGILLSRIHSLYSLSLVRYVLRGISGGHAMGFLFVRLLALLAREPACARDMLADEEAVTSSNNNSAVDNVTLISLVTGLLRTSDAPLMTAELIHLIQEMSEAFDAAHISFIYEQQQPLASSPSSSPISSTEQQLSRLMRADAREQFVSAFLGNSSRSILLLLKHVSSPALNESTRESLLQCIYACAFPTASSAASGSGGGRRESNGGGVHATSIATRLQLQQRRQQARALLLQHAAKWNETVLPSLQRFPNEDRVVHEENQAARIKQLRLIAQLRTALRLVKGANQGNANTSHNMNASGPYRPSAMMMSAAPSASTYAPPTIGFVAHGGRMPQAMMGSTAEQPQQAPHRPTLAFGNPGFNPMHPSFRG